MILPGCDTTERALQRPAQPPSCQPVRVGGGVGTGRHPFNRQRQTQSPHHTEIPAQSGGKQVSKQRFCSEVTKDSAARKYHISHTQNSPIFDEYQTQSA